ncbi:hypothetical protein [Oceanospirillum beijerinckii]|uniref:hypothetical protein n=1 Tax=Oceanospirillum beijerinckii TaxID=64976 RepID=UPI0004277145|nr:hypothetical protein [Oceanospirillum beijerinckii]MAC47241.1 hypothetical protein [Oceanospirillum sp.]
MQKKQPKKPVSVHWKVRITRAHHKPYIARTLSISHKQLHLESEFNLKAEEKVKVEISALFNGEKKVLVVLGKVTSSILLSSGSSYGLNIYIDRISAEHQLFIDNYISAREKMAINH